MVLLGTAAPFSCTKPVAADSTPPEKKDTTPDDPSKDNPQTPAEWDGKTFIDRTSEWETAFVDYGSYWLYEIHTCTTPYYHIKYIMEDEDFLGASEAVRKSPVDIKAAYEYFCVNVDESFLLNALKSSLPGKEELVWPEGYGHAQGYVFGFNEDKKFTGEYAHITSEHVF